MPLSSRPDVTAQAEPQRESVEDRLRRLISANESLGAKIAEHLASEESWQSERTLFRAMIDQVPDYLFVKDRGSRFVLANRAVAEDLGLSPKDLIGKTDFDLHPPALAARFFADDQGVIERQEPLIDIEEFVVDSSGRQKHLLTSKLPLRNEKGEVVGMVGISRDVTDRKRAEDQIHHMAHHDALTGLPNRTLLLDRLGQALRHASRAKSTLTVVFIDLDNFKSVNDSLGHAAGDMLLKTIAGRLVGAVRDTDTVARLGGDELVLLICDDDERGTLALKILERARQAIGEPVTVNGHALHVSASIGLASFPEDASDAETLLKHADLAMYQAKARGRDNVQAYAPWMDQAAYEKRVLIDGIRRGLIKGEFSIEYQPQIDLRQGRIIAVEALVRWNHPELGLIMPDRFIGLAEESGSIIALGEWVLREACRQNKAWQTAGAGHVTVCVNVSARQFTDPTWVDRVQAALKDSGLEPRYLELEVTESLLMRDVDSAVAIMKRLQALGVGLAIDDFGTGYSSLSALKNFPVSRLKIDRSFIGGEQSDRSIAKAVISLGQQLNLKVIAEGVETEEQAEFLANSQCDEVQGFHFCKPLDGEAIGRMLTRQTDKD